MKKRIVFVSILSLYFFGCATKHEWDYTVTPNVCYADAFYVKPDFQPKSYRVELTGMLNQDVLVMITTTHTNSEKPKERRVGLNYFERLKKGKLNYSSHGELYDDDIKVIVSGSDTTLYPNPESKGTVKGMPLGDVKIRITLN